MPYGTVFELDESATWKLEQVLENIRHLQAEMASDGLDVELVVHSDGIAALLRAPNRHAHTIEEMAAQGVRFAACHITMTSRGITPHDLLQVVEVVPSGVGELVQRQQEGWAYVRP